MNNDPLISIITVCFNSEKTITKTIESVLNQSYKNIEYIIIDGASTDSTLDIIKNYESKFNGKMKFISEKDQGIYDAMNKGIKLASGNMIGIVNSDDYYELDAVEQVVRHRTDERYQIIYGLLRSLNNGKEEMVYTKHYLNLENQMITHPTCFITKEIYSDFGLYNIKYNYSADYEFMLRMYYNSKVKFKILYHIISNFSIDGASSSVKAYRETLHLKYKYNLIGSNTYYFNMMKSKISLLIRK